MEHIFNKLVRDNIPDIIRNNGEKAITRVLSDEEYEEELLKKLSEETSEVINASSKDELLKELGKYKNKVLLKRGFSATFEEWINAAKYINDGKNVMLCERGIRGFDNTTRNILDLQAIPYIKNNTKFDIIIDPSHSAGNRYMIEPMALAAAIAGCDGLLIEVHNNPDDSICDKEQAIDIKILKSIIEKIEKLSDTDKLADQRRLAQGL